jgi:hypothetical protein
MSRTGRRGRGRPGRAAAKLPFRRKRRPDRIVAPVDRGGDLGLPGCLFAWLPVVGTPLASLVILTRAASGIPGTSPARPPPSLSRAASTRRDGAVLQYLRHYGSRLTRILSSPHRNQRFPHGVRATSRFCADRSQVTHSLWTAVEINYNCATGLKALKASPRWPVRDAGRVPAPALECRRLRLPPTTAGFGPDVVDPGRGMAGPVQLVSQQG